MFTSAETRPLPFACSPKALKEMTLSYFFVFLIGSRRRESNYFAQSVGTNEIISFCKVSTATEAPYGREKNLLAVPRNPRGERYSGFQVTGMIEGFFRLSREFLGGKAIWWFVIISASLDRVVLRINFYGRESWHGILWRFEFCPHSIMPVTVTSCIMRDVQMANAVLVYR